MEKKHFSFSLLVLLFVLAVYSVSVFAADVNSEPLDQACADTDGGLAPDAPGLVYSPNGTMLWPALVLDANSVEMGSDYSITKLNIDGEWYDTIRSAYEAKIWVNIPNTAQLVVTEINPTDKTVTLKYNYKFDRCIDSSTLLEYSCTESTLEKTITCPNGCSDGACNTEPANPTPTSNKTFNIDYGVSDNTLSSKVGPAAVGSSGDFWNTVVEAFNDNKLKTGLKYADKSASPITVQSINLGGTWRIGDRPGMGFKDAMMDPYSYPQYNKGGNSQVILSNVPAGLYSLYLYGRIDEFSNGDDEVTIDGTDYGRRTTALSREAFESPTWTEGFQYVKFPNLEVKENGKINILIRPSQNAFHDTLINGLQLVPQDGPIALTSQEVTCSFKNNPGAAFCYANDGQMCEASNENSCTFTINSAESSLNWRSTCAGTAVTPVDGSAKTIEFDCAGSKSSIYNIYSPYPTVYTTQYPITTNPITPIPTPEPQVPIPVTPAPLPIDYNNSSPPQNPPISPPAQSIDINAIMEYINSHQPPLVTCRDGCELEGKCYPFGYRKNAMFCSDDSNFTPILGNDAACNNNFECESNVCATGKCISNDFLQQVINWFKNLFGGE